MYLFCLVILLFHYEPILLFKNAFNSLFTKKKVYKIIERLLESVSRYKINKNLLLTDPGFLIPQSEEHDENIGNGSVIRFFVTLQAPFTRVRTNF